METRRFQPGSSGSGRQGQGPDREYGSALCSEEVVRQRRSGQCPDRVRLPNRVLWPLPTACLSTYSRLLARAIFVVDTAGKIAYVQVTRELTHEPDYDAVLDAVKKLL